MFTSVLILINNSSPFIAFSHVFQVVVFFDLSTLLFKTHTRSNGNGVWFYMTAYLEISCDWSHKNIGQKVVLTNDFWRQKYNEKAWQVSDGLRFAKK